MNTAAPPRVHQDVQVIGSNNTVIVAAGDVSAWNRGSNGPGRRGGSRRWLGVLTFITSASVATWVAISQSPPSWPEGKSARCRDGWYSSSPTRSGTCAGHGGVAVWRYAADHPFWDR